MENKLDILTKKLYDEGVDKARKEADQIIEKANSQAQEIIANAQTKADQLLADAKTDRENLKRKADSEMALSARQAIGALKQAIVSLISGTVAGELAKEGFSEKTFVQELLMTLVQKWDINSGNLDLEIILPESEKASFEALAASKYKSMLDKGLSFKAGNLKDSFVIQPKDGSYQITFSEELFKEFFNQYMRNFTKDLLFKESK